NAALLAIALARRNDFAVSGATLRRLVMMLVATAMMSAVLLGFDFVAGDVFAGANILVRLLLLAVAIGVSAVVYFGAAFALGGIDRQLLRSSLRRDAKPNRNTP
ncbi:MAG: lipid II flippase MurJ, partial [Pseudomonadota bacterium]